MTRKPDEVSINEVTPEQLDALLQRSVAQALADRDARLRAVRWPTDVDDMLATLAVRSKAQADALGDIHDRLARLEAAMGLGER